MHGFPSAALGVNWGHYLLNETPPKTNMEVSHPTWWATQGHRSLLSSPWYLNLGKYGEENWQRYHAVEPLAFEVTAAANWALCSLPAICSITCAAGNRACDISISAHAWQRSTSCCADGEIVSTQPTKAAGDGCAEGAGGGRRGGDVGRVCGRQQCARQDVARRGSSGGAPLVTACRRPASTVSFHMSAIMQQWCIDSRRRASCLTQRLSRFRQGCGWGCFAVILHT